MNFNVAFIGAGNMNSAVISGLVNKGFTPKNIIVSNPSPEKREHLANTLGINQTASNVEAAEFANVIVLGVKPHLICDVIRQLVNETSLKDKLIISVAAGTTIEQIQSALGTKQPVVRTMPNTPSQLGLGVSGIYASPETSDEQKQMTDQIMSATGMVSWLEAEAEIDHIIAVSGSGPAYFFLFMEAMEQKAISLGFSAEQARKLVQQTALGAATMVAENDVSISQLRENVTSKGGTTQAALDSFRADGLPQIVTKAMDCALHRAKEMAQNS